MPTGRITIFDANRLTYGVPQGSIFSPIIFGGSCVQFACVSVLDIPASIQKSGDHNDVSVSTMLSVREGTGAGGEEACVAMAIMLFHGFVSAILTVQQPFYMLYLHIYL